MTDATKREARHTARLLFCLQMCLPAVRYGRSASMNDASIQ
jgi:hypothetical protein